MMHHDRLEPLAAKDGLVGPDLVEALPLGEPAVFSILEDRRGVSGLRITELVERLTLKVDPDHGQKNPGLTVSGPQDFVMPACVFPANSFERIDLRKRPEEMGLEPFSLHPELFARLIHEDLFGILSERSTNKQPANDHAGRNNHAPDDESHA